MPVHPLLSQAQQSCRLLIPHLPRPTCFPLIKEAGIEGFTDPLFLEPIIPPIKSHPVSIFGELGRLDYRKVPRHWRGALKAWRNFQRTAATLRVIFDSSGSKQTRKGEVFNLFNSACAAIMLTKEGAQTELGHFLLSIALSSETGAFIAGHAPDLRRHQVEEILDLLANHAELLFWLGQARPQLREPCYYLASRHEGLFARMAAAELGMLPPLNELIAKANHTPVAAAAALALFPRFPKSRYERWISNLKAYDRLRYEVVQWTRHTWYGGHWLALCQSIGAPSDGGCWWYHWSRWIQPNPDCWQTSDVDPLWCAELAIDLRLPKLPAPLVHRLWQKLSLDKQDFEACALLAWSQQRRWPKGGDHGGHQDPRST